MDLTVTHSMGGRMEFEKTGIYPDYLIFSSEKLQFTWKFRRTAGLQTGVLKINGKDYYNFTFDETGCKVQEIKDGLSNSWEVLGVSFILSD